MGAMITQGEREELDRLSLQESDFYAELMFLVLCRLLPDRPRKEIADVVLEVYSDLAEKIEDAET